MQRVSAERNHNQVTNNKNTKLFVYKHETCINNKT